MSLLTWPFNNICGLWMDKLVIAASRVNHAHTQKDGKYTVAVGDPTMDGCNTEEKLDAEGSFG